MTTLTSTSPAPRFTDRVRDFAEAVYGGSAPASGPGVIARLRRAAYIVSSCIVWTVATLVVTGLLANLLTLH